MSTHTADPEGRQVRLGKMNQCFRFLTRTWKPPKGARVEVGNVRGSTFTIVFPRKKRVMVQLLRKDEKRRIRFVEEKMEAIVVLYDKVRANGTLGRWLTDELDGSHERRRMRRGNKVPRTRSPAQRQH